MSKITTAKGSRPSKKSISHVHIEAGTRGGFSVRTHYKEPPSRDGKMAYQEPDTDFFENHAGMLAHVGKLFGAPDGTPAHEKAESKAVEKLEHRTGKEAKDE